MLLTGLCLPYSVDVFDEGYSSIAATPPEKKLPPRRTRYHPGAFQMFLHEHEFADVLVDRCRAYGQFLGSTQLGLHLFETRAGLFFDLRLPSTPFAETVYRRVVDAKIQHVCAMCYDLYGEEDKGRFVVYQAKLISIAFLVTSTPHSPQTWVMASGPDAERRIDAETATAERHIREALDAEARTPDGSPAVADVRCGTDI